MNSLIEKYKIEHSALMEEWKQRHESKGYKNFICDGVINPEIWFNQDVRILFVLKEGLNKENPGFTTSLVKALVDPDERKSRIWKVVSEWYYGLLNTTSNTIPALKDYSELEDIYTAIENCAVINVKKSNGVYPSKEDDLLDYISQDYDLIKRQIECINPTIIVCGYTFHLLKDYSRGKKKADYQIFSCNTSKLSNDIGCYDINGRTVISYYHPSNFYPEVLNFYGMVGMYRDYLNKNKASCE